MSILDEQKNQELYNSDLYLKNTNMWEDSTSNPRAMALRKIINNAEISSEIKSWMDIGCGSGGVIRNISLSKDFYNCGKYLGLDISSKAIEIASLLYPKASQFNVKFELIDPNKIELLVKDEFSLVSMIHVVEHVPDMLEFIKTYSQNAKYIYINVPIEHTLNYVIRRGTLKGLYKKYGHLHFFDENFIDEFLVSNGFEILSRVYSLDYEGRENNLTKIILNSFRGIACKIFGPSFANFLLSGFSYGVLIKKNS